MTTLTARSSTIYIAAGQGAQVFRSMGEVPPVLRRKLQESTQSANSATILIADRQGREELVRALHGEASNVRCRLAETIRSRQRLAQPAPGPSASGKRIRRWLEILLPLAIGASLWFLSEIR